ncbi:MAG: hypothetical protein KMY53_01245 [Desulfarculus sp.]|nr:hypothetical protein [Pseudomonadota bacterium]MBV1716584.1 hypothetical protein [Desulfarculus sp.]MBU4577114.1 hypothetical protein [Pseudomonadota bacterium]MBU4597712.1 hypothetical protein [Pseudomonadota bacterium]MBV1736762.1 hypothetical protein [Desulfarculus sp.]
MYLSSTDIRQHVKLWGKLLCEIPLLFFLPIIWIMRNLLSSQIRRKAISIWTGAPIITVAKNCRVERLLGFNSISIVSRTYFITDEFDYDLARLAKGNHLLSILYTYAAFLLVCLMAVQVHTYVDGGLLPSHQRRRFNPLELCAYRLLGIKLLVWTYGADVRTHRRTIALGKPNCCTDCDQVGVACICDDKLGAANYRRVYRAAAGVFSMGDMLEYTPASRNDLFFWPIDLDADHGRRYAPTYPALGPSKPLRVVHAPNHRMFKGTRYLEKAVAKFRSEGVAIDLVLAEHLPNQAALELYRSADLIFDQCLIGFHGYFALEGMALGKPVMCFVRDRQRYLLAPDECPLIEADVVHLTDQLRQWATIDRAELQSIGMQSRAYIEKYYSYRAFSGRLRKAYQDMGLM